MHIDLYKNAYTQKQKTYTYPQTDYARRHAHAHKSLLYDILLVAYLLLLLNYSSSKKLIKNSKLKYCFL